MRGTIVGVVIGLAANALSLAQIQYACMNCPVSYGIPFRIAEMDGYASPQRVLWGGVVANLLAFVVVGIFLLAAAKALSRRRRKPRFH
jgi:large-conductance mechanosensitive channel